MDKPPNTLKRIENVCRKDKKLQCCYCSLLTDKYNFASVAGVAVCLECWVKHFSGEKLNND